jgi:fatty acid desaturase
MTPQDINNQLYGTILMFGLLPLTFIASIAYLLSPKTKGKKSARLAANIICGITAVLLLIVIYYAFLAPTKGI